MRADLITLAAALLVVLAAILAPSILPPVRAHITNCKHLGGDRYLGTYAYEVEVHTREFANVCPATITLE